MLAFGVFIVMIYAFVFMGRTIIFAQLTSIFAAESFNKHRHRLQVNISNDISAIKCPFGIELNIFNYDRLHK